MNESKLLLKSGHFCVLFFYFTFFTNAQTTINSEDFESGWGIWNSGGNDSERISNSPLNNSFSIRLRDDKNAESSMYTNDLDLSAYGSIDLEYDFRAESFGNNHDFFIEYSSDGGANWDEVAQFVKNPDFNNDQNYLNQLVSIDGSAFNFTSNSRLRIRCDSKKDEDLIYFDNITIRGYPRTSYCSSAAAAAYDNYDDDIRLVTFNTINNPTPDYQPGYSDFTSISTTVQTGTTYDLDVKVNTAADLGNWEYRVVVWIDWDQNFNFDNDEEYDLGTVNNQLYASPTGAPYSILVPIDAIEGTTRMRISLKWIDEGYQTSCETGFEGEVEDYSIVVSANTISTGTISPLSYCNGNVISVPYIVSGTYNAGNIFTAQLSDATGDFSAPASIGTLTSSTDGTINATLPASISGNGYRIRVVSSGPVIIGTDNGSDITISDGPAQPSNISGNASPAVGSTQTYSVTNVSGVNYSWTIPADWTLDSGNGTNAITVTVGNDSGYVEVTPDNSCGTGLNRSLGVGSESDVDGDGVADIADLDNDNDGILDTEECGLNTTVITISPNGANPVASNATTTGGYPVLASTTGNTGSDGGSPGVEFPSTFNVEATLGANDSNENNYVLSFSMTSFDDGLQLVAGGTQILYFNQTNWQAQTDFTAGEKFDSDLGADGWTPWNGEGNPELVFSNGTIQFMVDTNVNDGSGNPVREDALQYMDTSGVFVLNPVAIDLFQTGGVNFEFSNANDSGPSNIQGLTIKASVYVCTDTDGDGVFNKFDVDSDADGCPDAMEGSYTMTYGDLDMNDAISGAVDSNGIPVLVGLSGQTDVSSADISLFGNCTGENIDFDGVDDYLSTDVNLSGLDEVTVMTWVKYTKSTPPSGKWIMGQDIFQLKVDNGFKIDVLVKTVSGDVSVTTIGNALKEGVWNHIAVSYNATTGVVMLFQNGEEVTKINGGSGPVHTIANAVTDFEIGGDSSGINADYFLGSIVDAKVYSKALTIDEVREQIYQQIENVSGNVQGVVVPRSIGSLVWDDLELYLKLQPSSFGGIDISDFSNKSRIIAINGMTTVQDTNAPLPLIASNSGEWATESTWEFGSVWEVEALEETQPWGIVELSDGVDLTSGNVNIALFGLIIPETSSFTMDGTVDIDTGTGTGYSLTVSDYLELDGVLDLEGESQLFQNSDADNIVGSNGYLERDQQGTLDTFTYNYWSSPVSENGIDYRLVNVMANVNWIGGYNGSSSPLSLAEYWIWKFVNSASGDYSQWQHTKSTGIIKIGEGYTMKGPGAGVSAFQNYAFRGIPNNGDISLMITPGNDYLVGNPYPSALDADQFIDDNEVVLKDEDSDGGALLFWEHWGGGSHNLKDYQGGYAYYTKSGGTSAVSHPNVSQDNSGVKVPGRYVPVGQGFFVSSVSGIEGFGNIQFNNGQRNFTTEVDSNDSWFMKSDGRTEENQLSSDLRIKIRLGVDMPKGFHRQLLVTVDERATEAVDYGFEAKLADDFHNDMFWVLNENKYVIQGVPTINKNTEIPLGFSMKSEGIMKLGIDQLENVPETMSLYIKELETGNTFELSENLQFEVKLEAGNHVNKYALVFHPKLVSEREVQLKDGMSAYLNNNSAEIHISKIMDTHVSGVQLYNLNGQLIRNWQENLNANEIFLPVNLNSGVYLLKVETTMGIYSKKLLNY